MTSVSLQGCQWAIPRHQVPNWELQPNYLRVYDFSPPGSRASQLNSCEDPSVPVTIKCSGHGRCVEWFDTLPSFAFNISEHRLSFCECDQDWADPECRTERKSQLTAFLLSLFLGMFGADQFYLGFIWPQGIVKLLTLGGVGIWWIYDIVRIGSSPVLTANQFRVAHNVHHWAFVLVVLCFTGFLGFALSIWSINHHRLQKARDLILLRSSGPRGAVPHKRRGMGSFVPAPSYGAASPA
eukprot:CAMPEP_0171109586 /NCGR_PEP_ID=MMETSP0766_2-20121228/70863_1 /TAXON_ID=439317 /ORGANISM="Gambierdiscus australes, Strain CAWD 149" /LENGTH=238 /DNA_ID=CAMNT_0011571341 /DNA_START=161 /DNA_END=877 /DNA_ORIENTATION=-